MVIIISFKSLYTKRKSTAFHSKSITKVSKNRIIAFFKSKKELYSLEKFNFVRFDYYFIDLKINVYGML